MSLLSSLGGLPPALALAIAATLLALLAWLSWRRPTWLFLLALASLAIQPQVLISGTGAAYDWGLHHTLVTWAWIVNGWKYGVRRETNWPVLALIVVFVLSLALGNLHPKLTFGFMLMSLAIFSLPWSFTQVIMAPGSRRACATVVMLTPLLSIVAGVLLQALDLTTVYDSGSRRLRGATGDGAILAVLAFAGFAVALHESTRPGRKYAKYLAALNLAIVVLTGGRMALLASLTFFCVYLTLSKALRAQWREHRAKLLLGVGVVVVALLVYWPTLQWRMFEAGRDNLVEYQVLGEAGTVNLSVRDKIWRFYYGEFLLSPIFGRGVGAGFIAAADFVAWPRKTPHNEYLHLMVSGGVIGFLLLCGALIRWSRRLLRQASPNDRNYLQAMLPALGLFAITEDILAYPAALAIYAYFGVLLTRPSLLIAPRLPVTDPSAADALDVPQAQPEEVRT